MTVALLNVVRAEWYFTPVAGSHTFEVFVYSDQTGMSHKANTARPLAFVVEEQVRANTANNIQTSG